MVNYIIKDYFVEDLMTFSKLKIIGDSKRKFSSISTIDSIKENSLIYINDEKYFNLAINSSASVIVIPKNFEDKLKDKFNEKKVKDIDKTFILAENPKLVFAYASRFFKIRSPAYGIDKTVVSRSKIDKKTVEIAPYVNIGKNVKLGKDVIIGSFVSIGDNCNIGDNTVIFSGVKIYENVEIGKNCIIHSNTVIGSDGFGFVPDNESYQKIEHLGKIIIEDNVEIGSNCSIDRATIGETRIKNGTKIDNLVQIAHNVNIGENTIICAQVGIAGGASLGNHVTCAGQVGISDHAMVEDNVIAGAQAGLTPKRYAKNSFLLGTPAIDAMVFKKSIVLFYQLPDLVKKIYKLEELIKELDNKLKN